MSTSTIRCPQGHKNPAGQQFCGSCGTSLEGLCPNGHSTPAGQQFCGKCGVSLRRPTPTEQELVTPPSATAPIPPLPSGHTLSTDGSLPSPLPGAARSSTDESKAVRKLLLGFFGVAALIIFVIVTMLVSAHNSSVSAPTGGQSTSYRYGQSTASEWALPIWQGALEKPYLFPKIDSARAACQMSIDVVRNNSTPQEMVNLSDSDIVDGCADQLAKVTGQSKR